MLAALMQSTSARTIRDKPRTLIYATDLNYKTCRTAQKFLHPEFAPVHLACPIRMLSKQAEPAWYPYINHNAAVHRQGVIEPFIILSGE